MARGVTLSIKAKAGDGDSVKMGRKARFGKSKATKLSTPATFVSTLPSRVERDPGVAVNILALATSLDNAPAPVEAVVVTLPAAVEVVVAPLPAPVKVDIEGMSIMSARQNSHRTDPEAVLSVAFPPSPVLPPVTSVLAFRPRADPESTLEDAGG
ncbi:hypothetical protein LTR95_011350 [Oleoguttula sp. CCFEE 5521]